MTSTVIDAACKSWTFATKLFDQLKQIASFLTALRLLVNAHTSCRVHRIQRYHLCSMVQIVHKPHEAAARPPGHRALMEEVDLGEEPAGGSPSSSERKVICYY